MYRSVLAVTVHQQAHLEFAVARAVETVDGEEERMERYYIFHFQKKFLPIFTFCTSRRSSGQMPSRRWQLTRDKVRAPCSSCPDVGTSDADHRISWSDRHASTTKLFFQFLSKGYYYSL